jgi:hypothetical protein
MANIYRIIIEFELLQGSDQKHLSSSFQEKELAFAYKRQLHSVHQALAEVASGSDLSR